MGFLAPKTPSPPQVPLPPPSAHPPTFGGSLEATSVNQTKKAAAVAEGLGMDNTVKTSPQGLKPPSTAKTLLG